MDGRLLGMIPHDSSRPGSGSPDQWRGHRVPAALLVVMLATASFVGLAGRAGAAPGRAVEENRIATGDLGVTRPTGIAWDPVADVLWVGEPGDAALVGISRDGGEVRDVRRVDVDPATATVDAAGALVSTDGARVTIEDDAAVVATHDAPVQDATAITTDPATDDVVVLDTAASALVRVGSDGEVTRTALDEEVVGDGLDAVAVDPSTGLVNVADWSTHTVVAVDGDGAVVGSRTVSSESLVDPGAMTFAPTADSTDDADAMALFVVDAGSQEVAGGVVELSLAAVELAAVDDVAPLVRTTQLSAWSPPSPDSAGVTWLADQDRLLVADSEVNEMPIFANVNLFQATRSGTLVRTGVTLPWSDEPTGLSHDLANGRLFVSDDRSSGRLHTVRPGSDGRWGTSDDGVTTATMGSFGFGTIDAEDVAYHAPSDTVFVIDGVNAEVWRISPGPDGRFTGGGATGDDTITHFDVARHGISDPEGIVVNVFDDTLLIADRRSDLVTELTLSGGLVRVIDISAAGARTPAGITLAPSSDGAGTSMYVVDRGVDNDADPSENDGRLHELRFPGAVGDQPPIAGDDAATTVMGQAVTIDVLANDADLAGDPLSLGAVSNPGSGQAVVDPDQTVTYTPDPGFVGTDSFAYEVCDPDPQCDTGTVTVTVLAANVPPVAVDDAVTTGVGVARTITVLANDTDVEGQSLRVADLVQPADGTTVVNGDQTVTYTPDPGFAGTDTFTYRASDGIDTSAPATVTVTVTANWDPPVVVQVASDTDDAEEAADGTMDRGSSDLEMVQEATVQTVGVRFDGVPVPPGAKVAEAWVQFQADETDGTPTTLQLAFQDAADPPTFGVIPFDISSRPRLAQTVTWTPPAWNVVGERGAPQRTPDLSTVVQQVVDRPGWNDGNAMVLVVTGSGKRTAEAHDGFPAESATLHVRFEGGGTGGNTAPDVVASADATFLGSPASLSGAVSDDGLPGGPLAVSWAKVSGPGTVTFADASALDTTATFSQPGTYELELSVDDGELVGTDRAPVEVVAPGDTGPSTVSFGIFGDYGNGSADAAEVAAMLEGLGPDFLVTVGDNNYGPGDQDSTVGPLYADWIGNYRGAHGDGAALNAFFPALGDEDIEAGGGLADYLDYFTLPGGGNVAPAASGNERYYDVVRGPVHVFVLNPHSSEPDGRDVSSVQAAWLQAGLAASTSPWNVVVVHDPPYSSNGNDTDTQWPYAAWGADLVVSGDRHVYERLEVGGLTYLVSGLGGASIASPAPSLLAQSQAYYRGGFGAVLAEACASGLTVRFQSVDDGVVDTHTLGTPCGTEPGPATPTDLVATGADQAVALTWTDVATTETGYEVERSTAGPAGPFAPAVTLGVDASDWTDAGLTDEVEHCYRVRATGFAGPSEWSTVACATPAVPDAPVAVDDTAATDEDVAVVIDVLANDTDADGDPLTVTNLSAPGDGTVVLEADGTVTYAPDPDFHGTDTFTYTASDGASSSDPATVTVTVGPVNDPPVAVDDVASTDEDLPVGIDVVANDTDVDGDALSATNVSTPADGTAVVQADGTVTYTPAPGFAGIDTFTYTAADGNGGTDTATVTVTVGAVDDAPVLVDDLASTDEDVSVTIDVLANDTDPDGDPLVLDAVSPGAHGTTAVTVDGTVLYMPAPDFHGVDTFTYTASDGTFTSGPATVTVTVDPVDDLPVAVDDAAVTDEDVAVVVDVLANDTDVDGDPLTVTNLSAPANGTAVVEPDGTVTYTPAANFHGVDAFTYTASDGTSSSNVVTVTITVAAVGDAPVAVDDLALTDEDVAVVVDVLANDTDVDGDPLTATNLSAPANGTAVVAPDGTVTYTPAANFHGVDAFTYAASDGTSPSNVATVSVTVAPVNDPPVAVDDAASTDEDVAVGIDVLANDTDVDGDALVVASLSAPANGTAVLAADGTVTYTPAPGFVGVDTFTTTVDDGNGGTDTATVTVTVAVVDDPPVAVDDVATTDEDVAVTVDVLANDTDPEGGPLTVADLSVPADGTATVAPDGTVTYTPAPDFDGVDTFTYRAHDGTSTSDPATVTVTVAAVPDAPDAVDDTVTTDEDVTADLDLLANDVDVDGDLLAVTAVGPATNGVVDVQPDGTGTYTPAVDFHGVDTFTYTIDDGTGRSDTATVTVTVTAVNDVPVAADDTATTDEDTAVVVDVLANDTDADLDDLVVTNLSSPSSGTAQLQPDGTVTYTPAADANGTDTFTYTASDGVATSVAATVTITVAAVNDPPVARDDTASTRVDTAVTVDVLANDDDVEGPLDAASVSVTTGPANGGTAVGSGGAITYTPNGGFSGTDGFAYRVCDADGACATATVTVTVANDVVLQFAQSESTALGAIVSGTFASTVNADGVSEVLTEQHSGGPRASRTSWLDHRWALQVVNGQAMALEVVASRSANGEGDDFAFELSRDGGSSWQRILTVATAGTPTLHTGAMPPATTGSILVRVVDTNRTAGNSAIDTVTVDRLVVRTTNPLGAVPAVAVTAPDAQADEGGGAGTFRLTRSTTSGPLTVNYTVAGTATPGSDYTALSGTATFAAGQAQVDVTVSPLQDTQVEGDESVELVLAVSAAYTIVPPGSATVVIADDDVAAAEARATAQATVAGSVQGGNLLSTHFDDGDVQTLREEYAQGPWRARLDHRWTFQVAAGSSVQFRARAHRLGTEDMVFAWSTDGSTWTPLVTVTSATEQVLTASLPAGPARTVQVRVTDLVDDKNDVDRGSVVVDELVITSTP